MQPSYLDVKQLNDEAALWRIRVSKAICQYRLMKIEISRSRNLRQRHYFMNELTCVRNHIKITWKLYRTTHQEALYMTEQYMQNMRPQKWRKSA